MPRTAVLSGATGKLGAIRRPGAFRPGSPSPGRGVTNAAVLRLGFTAGAACFDALTIMAATFLTGQVYSHGGHDGTDLVFGLTVAGFFVVPNVLRQDYAISRYLSFKGHAKRAFTVWNIAVVSALVLAFLTKTSGDLSRGTSAIVYVIGFAGVLGVRALLAHAVATRAATGQIASRRIFLVGNEAMIRAFTGRHVPHRAGLRLVAAAVLRPGPETLVDDLTLAAASARVLRPDDIYILVPWADREMLESCINTFLRVPASIHLAPEDFFDQFDDLHIVRTGSIASIHLVRRPLSPVEVVIKRVVDLVLSAFALVVLAPVFAAVALAIKIDSPGPVFFRQRRYGFNQEPFRILKFRSMSALEDDRTLRQASQRDGRITRVGRFIRRTNVDELPQLFNVLKGDMSLVGPRPHALAHDQLFEREVALYARRHNVRPGITGWAQVNGWRGETDTPEKVQGRVEHDLYYIDNWSLLFDIAIMVRTVLSRKAYKNAG